MKRPKQKDNGAEVMKTVSIRAFAAEIERWARLAEADNRPLSNWLRLRLLSCDSRDEELAARASERLDRSQA